MNRDGSPDGLETAVLTMLDTVKETTIRYSIEYRPMVAMTASDRKWYGLGDPSGYESIQEAGYHISQEELKRIARVTDNHVSEARLHWSDRPRKYRINVLTSAAHSVMAFVTETKNR